jgi:hypothetical protein
MEGLRAAQREDNDKNRGAQRGGDDSRANAQLGSTGREQARGGALLQINTSGSDLNFIAIPLK